MPMVKEMSRQGNSHFPERVEHAVTAAEKLADEIGDGSVRSGDITSSPEYQEIVRLKVILETETSRQLAETAHVSAELERSTLAEAVKAHR